MYNYLSKKFKIDEEKFIDLANANSDFQELFDDYEELNINLTEKQEQDIVLDTLYNELLDQLEEEISDILSKHNKN
jgi:uncharacterized protein YdcH (DUF465 family)